VRALKHAEHELQYVLTNVTTVQSARITDSGDVETFTLPEVEDIHGDSFVYCLTCDDRVIAGQDGLAQEWQQYPAQNESAQQDPT
jgi:hypothetical protein